MEDRHMKRYSTSLVTTKMHIKMKMRCYYILIRMAKIKKIVTIPTAGEVLEKLDYSYIASWWECKLVQSLWKTIWQLIKKLKYDPAIAALGIDPRELKTYVHTAACTQKFMAGLF